MEDRYRELDFDNLEYGYAENEYEFICESCGNGFDNIRPQKVTTYNDDGEVIRSDFVIICPVCSSIIER